MADKVRTGTREILDIPEDDFTARPVKRKPVSRKAQDAPKRARASGDGPVSARRSDHAASKTQHDGKAGKAGSRAKGSDAARHTRKPSSGSDSAGTAKSRSVKKKEDDPAKRRGSAASHAKAKNAVDAPRGTKATQPAGRRAKQPASQRQDRATKLSPLKAEASVKAGEKAGRAKSRSGSAAPGRATGKRTAAHAGKAGARHTRPGAGNARKDETRRIRDVEPGIGMMPAHHSGKAPSRKRVVPKQPPRDMFLEEPRSAKKSRVKKRKPAKKRMGRFELGANIFFATAIAVMLALGGLMVFKYGVFREMKLVVEAQTFYEGTTVEGVDVSNMTLAAANDYWGSRIEPGYAGRTVDLGEDGVVTAADVGYYSDYAAVLSNAWSAGRRGSLEQRYRAAVNRQYHPVAYSVNRTLYTDAGVDAFVQTIAQRYDKPAVDAAIESFDVANYAFVFRESAQGRRLDAEGLGQAIRSALDAGGGSAEVVVETVQPEVTTDEVTSRYGMVSSAVTNASSSSNSRIKNIELAVSLINGTRVGPGETFSFNECVGKRTTDRGFRRATAYSGGEVTEEVGGGICQVSTTLFNAAVKADMEIVERHSHSLTVSYVDRGKDAAVNWNSQDMKFKNNSGDDVYVCCFVSKDKRVRFAIFGRLLPNGETITLEGVTTGTNKYDTKYEPSPFLAPGQTKVIEKGKNGYTADTYKIRWDAAGNELSREKIFKSSYKSKDEIVQYGP